MTWIFFRETLENAWNKVIKHEALSAWEYLVLWFNKIGLIGLGYAVVGIIFMFRWFSTGTDANLIVFTVMATLFVEKNFNFLGQLWTGAFNKYFPKGIVVPFINRKIK